MIPCNVRASSSAGISDQGISILEWSHTLGVPPIYTQLTRWAKR